MGRSDRAIPPDRDIHDVVADALRDERSNFAAFVRSRVRADEVDDVLQIAALRAMERAHSLDDPDRVVAWLYRIHRNLIIDTHRLRASERSHVELLAEPPEEPSAPAGSSCACSITQAQRLRPNYASILSLVDRDGVGLSEAARTLHVSTNNATVRLHRARKALREAMREHCGVTDPLACGACRCVDDACCVA